MNMIRIGGLGFLKACDSLGCNGLFWLYDTLHLDGFITGVTILPILGLLRVAEHSVILGF